MKRIDLIRALPDEALAAYIGKLVFLCEGCPAEDVCDYEAASCEEVVVKHLMQEVSE